MGMTMTEKILAQHAGRDAVQAGDLLVAQVDLVLANDITGPPAIAEFEKIGRPVFDKDKIALVPDHFSPCKDIKSATMCKRMRDFARQHEITNYFEVGRMGIEHALLPDSGLVAPGEIIIGADSHTCTYGALNALSTGMGQTDIGAAMASGTTWFKVPATIKVELTGKLPKYVKGKDIILTLIGMSLSSRKVKGGMGFNIAMGLLLSFSYILFDMVSSTFAISGATSPQIAVWIPNILYAFIAIGLYFKAPK